MIDNDGLNGIINLVVMIFVDTAAKPSDPLLFALVAPRNPIQICSVGRCDAGS